MNAHQVGPALVGRQGQLGKRQQAHGMSPIRTRRFGPERAEKYHGMI
jgi:hypothetical protein